MKILKRISLALAGLALATVGSAASLGPAEAKLGINFLGVTNLTGGALTVNTQWRVLNGLASDDGEDFFAPSTASDPGPCDPGLNGVCLGDDVDLTPITFFSNNLIGLVLTFDGGGIANRYTYTVTSQNAPAINVNGSQQSIDIFTNGIFHDSGNSNGDAFDDDFSQVLFSFGQSCNGSCGGESGLATFITPRETRTTHTPEPGTMALLGSGLLGSAVVVRRRLRKA